MTFNIDSPREILPKRLVKSMFCDWTWLALDTLGKLPKNRELVDDAHSQGILLSNVQRFAVEFPQFASVSRKKTVMTWRDSGGSGVGICNEARIVEVL